MCRLSHFNSRPPRLGTNAPYRARYWGQSPLALQIRDCPQWHGLHAAGVRRARTARGTGDSPRSVARLGTVPLVMKPIARGVFVGHFARIPLQLVLATCVGVGISGLPSEGQWADRLRERAVVVQVLHAAVQIDLVVAGPPISHGWQRRRVEVDRDVLARSEDHEMVLVAYQQRRHITVLRIEAPMPRVGTMPADVVEHVP